MISLMAGDSISNGNKPSQFSQDRFVMERKFKSAFDFFANRNLVFCCGSNQFGANTITQSKCETSSLASGWSTALTFDWLVHFALIAFEKALMPLVKSSVLKLPVAARSFMNLDMNCADGSISSGCEFSKNSLTPPQI